MPDRGDIRPMGRPPNDPRFNEGVIQSWSLADQNALRAAALSAYGLALPRIHDIVAVGGRVMGFYRDDSDIDIIIYIDGHRSPRGRRVAHLDFFGMDLTVTRQPVEDYLQPHVGYRIPAYSLKDRVIYNVDATGINDWLDRRIEQAANWFFPYDFLEGRDLTRLIVPRRQPR